ncbi:hypothetical protein ILUMI_00345 [Ignelater luminosus]|uniref:Uncharacterized protein n=1 Tax=Ignelater luminosus TaxID=2038154 RepID=A0A8K0DKM7_IGNLU|nr:hypothetical protein ILUMI_00345 [Ignelater luminosus]
MIKCAIIVLFSCLLYAEVQAKCRVMEGYYWRDFTGEVPEDALPGGTDTNGKPIFIGQVLQLGFLIPVKIYLDNPTAYYEFERKEFPVTENIKILCTQYPEHFEWIRTSNEEIKFLTEKHLVIGGYQPRWTTFIGRVRHGSETLVGKLLFTERPNDSGLHVTSNGNGIQYNSYEILVFNPY